MSIGIICPKGFEDGLGLSYESTRVRPNKDQPVMVDFYSGKLGGKKVIFVPRHDDTELSRDTHHLRNMILMYLCGAHQVIGISEAKSFQDNIGLRQIVMPDQLYVQRGIEPTFYGDGLDVETRMKEPVCKDTMIGRARSKKKDLESKCVQRVHIGGIFVHTPGPATATAAEVEYMRTQIPKKLAATSEGWAQLDDDTTRPLDLRNPRADGLDIPTAVALGHDMIEAYAAKELALCYAHLGMITSYENPKRPSLPGKKAKEIFKDMIPKMHALLEVLIGALPEDQDCRCSRALEGAGRGIDMDTAHPLLVKILKDRGAF